MNWRCLWLPWHRVLAGSFWVSEVAQVGTCSCGRQFVLNHDVRAVIPYDEKTKAFYSQLNSWKRRAREEDSGSK
jgi:hypothetical protein